MNEINNFLMKQNVIRTVTCILIASAINELINEFFDGVVKNAVSNHEDDKKFDELTITVFNKKLRIGKLILIIVKVLVIFMILYLVDKYI